jgi:hypothetical protein
MNSFPRAVRFWTALFLLAYWSAMNAAPAAARLAPSQSSGVTSIATARDADVLTIQRTLEHRLVAQKLADYGVQPLEVRARLATLSDQDVHRLATVSKGLPSGGDAMGVGSIGDGGVALIAILVIVILFIVIVQLLKKEIVVR